MVEIVPVPGTVFRGLLGLLKRKDLKNYPTGAGRSPFGLQLFPLMPPIYLYCSSAIMPIYLFAANGG